MKKVVENVKVNVVETKTVEKTFYVGECPICGTEQKRENSDDVDIICDTCERHERMMYKRNKWFDAMKDAVMEDIVYSYSDPYAFAFRRPDGTILYVCIDEDTSVIENVEDDEREYVEEKIKLNKFRDAYFNAQPKKVDPLEEFYREKGLIE